MTVSAHRVRAELAAAGVELRGPLPGVGGTVRAPGIGKGPANDACAVTVLPDRVLYLDHSSGASGVIWSDGPGASRRAPTREEIAEAERVSRLAAEQRAERHRAGIADARRAYAAAAPLVSHPYADAKDNPMPGCRVTAAGVLLVPLTGPDGALMSLERIQGDGERNEKKAWPGAPKAGAAYRLGTVLDASTVLVCEGAATGAALHAATGHAVVCAMDCGNLARVATALRERHPRADIVVCGDDDRGTVGNPGRRHATAAARLVGARLAFPPFCADCAGRCKDFDDTIACERGRGRSGS